MPWCPASLPALFDQLLDAPDDHEHGPETYDIIPQITQVMKQNQRPDRYQNYSPEDLAPLVMLLRFRQVKPPFMF